MLKLNPDSIQHGTQFILTEKWHDKLVAFSKNPNLPYEYTLISHEKMDKDVFYIFESEKNSRGKRIKIAIEEFLLLYYLGSEVPDANVGFSFKEYMPLEGVPLLITNFRNPNEVVPGALNAEAELIEFDEESLIALSFKIFFMNGTGFASVRYYTEGSRKSQWKLLLHSDESYMTDYEKMFRDTVIHKMHVSKSAQKLARYLSKEGATEHANALLKRAEIHDESKISCVDELHSLSRIINDKSTLRDASKQLSPIKKDAIALHWKHNTHHPEHFASPIDMTKLDIMEMCCDWHARSTQYGTDFLAYVEKQQAERFHFPDWMFPEIMHYCKILASDI